MRFQSARWTKIAALMFCIGCGGGQPNEPTGAGDGHGDHNHAEGHGAGHHSHADAPHDGTIADWGGGKFHVEFVVDHDKHEASVYILDENAKEQAPISADEIQLAIKDPMTQVTLKAAPQDGDPDGLASRFVGTHENIGIVREFSGTITGVVDGTPYSGDFAEQPHVHKD